MRRIEPWVLVTVLVLSSARGQQTAATPEDEQDTWWCTTWGEPFRDTSPASCKWLLECNMRILGVPDRLLDRPEVLKGLSDFGIRTRVTLPLMGYMTVWSDKRLQDLLRRFPDVRSLNRHGNYDYTYATKTGQAKPFSVADPLSARFKDFYVAMLREFYGERLRGKPLPAGFAFMADHPELPGIFYDGGGNAGNRESADISYPNSGYQYRMGFALSEESLRTFANSYWFEHGSPPRPGGRMRVDMKTGKHPDGSACLLWELFVARSKKYSPEKVQEYWDDLWNRHGGRPPRHGDHASFINAMYWSKIRAAVEEFNQETHQRFFVWKEGGVEFYDLAAPKFGDRKIVPPNWFRSAGPGNGSFATYPDEAIVALSSATLPVANDTRSKLWVEADLGTPGNNGGRITPRQVGYILQYFFPQHPTSVIIWDVNSANLFSAEHLEHYLPYARILSRMRFTGDWLGLYDPAKRGGTRGTIDVGQTQVQWSLCGGRGTAEGREPFLIWMSNAGRTKAGQFYAADAEVKFSHDLSDYGLSGAWFAFDVATMKLVGGGSGGKVELSLNIPAWQWRTVYIMPGRADETLGYLYSSSRPLAQTRGNGSLELKLKGCRGMYYRVAVRSKAAPSAVTYKDSANTRALQAAADLSAILDHCNEGYFHDAAGQCLYTAYQDGVNDGLAILEIRTK
ncbi:MAG: hypothetical protein FJ290_13960 [Planctomycetes bacterium]|nr:hypothetical protein [Planctomycetota bacterium]